MWKKMNKMKIIIMMILISILTKMMTKICSSDAASIISRTTKA